MLLCLLTLRSLRRKWFVIAVLTMIAPEQFSLVPGVKVYYCYSPTSYIEVPFLIGYCMSSSSHVLTEMNLLTRRLLANLQLRILILLLLCVNSFMSTHLYWPMAACFP
uniref:Uncharacterized protein n=1 Tax=Schistocephalus solidus TaxID=70667 RepID=A0A0X3Q0Z0_SCHSO